MIKIGNIASGAADFVLQTGSSLSDIQFYGVAAIQTNFDFLAAVRRLPLGHGADRDQRHELATRT